MKILFMGTPDFAAKSLKSLIDSKYDVCAVFTQPDKPKGRGYKLTPSEVKKLALENDIEVFQPAKLKTGEAFDIIKELNPDIIVVVAYGKILPKEIIEFPKYGCINVHGSLLPKYRGAAPIQWAVLNGDKITGITTMFMDIGMDTGDMILKKKVEIGEDETTGELWERLADLGGKALVQTLELIEKGNAKRIKQSDDFSMAPMLDKKMAKIDFKKQNSTQIKNLVRGLNPIIGAYCYISGKKVKFWKVQKHTNIENMISGTVIESDPKKGLFIKTMDGMIEVLEIQGENAKKMPISDFLRGNHIEKGCVCE